MAIIGNSLTRLSNKFTAEKGLQIIASISSHGRQSCSLLVTESTVPMLDRNGPTWGIHMEMIQAYILISLISHWVLFALFLLLCYSHCFLLLLHVKCAPHRVTEELQFAIIHQTCVSRTGQMQQQHGAVCTPPTCQHGNQLYCSLLLHEKLLIPCTVQNHTVVLHGVIGKHIYWNIVD